MELNNVWDTNVIIYYLQSHLTPSVKIFLDNIIDNHKPAISVITEIELLAWQSATDKDIKLLKDFIADCTVIELSHSIKLKSIEVRKQFKLKLPDAIIAASALVNDSLFITRNVADFGRISAIKLLNPFEE